jgi:hypothetical protein
MIQLLCGLAVLRFRGFLFQGILSDHEGFHGKMFLEKALEVSYQITNEWVAVKRSDRYCEARKFTHLCIARQFWYVIDHHAARAA